VREGVLYQSQDQGKESMKFMQRICLLAISVVCFAIGTFAQKAPDVLVTVGGEVEHPLKLTRADLDTFARQSLRAKDHDGKEYKYEGVAVVDVLEKAGIKFGKACAEKLLQLIC
jgi:hypothetical protein